MKSKILVVTFSVAVVAIVLGLRSYFDEEGEQEKIGEVPCTGLLPTAFELQEQHVPVNEQQTCELMQLIATMQPTGEKHRNDPGDPWHYYGRMRILPKEDAWFLVFNARASSGFHPEFSLQHRKGVGWAIVGQFDAVPLLRKLGVLDRLDTALLRSPESLVPTDQEKPM
jgi:hypothetical protein